MPIDFCCECSDFFDIVCADTMETKSIPGTIRVTLGAVPPECLWPLGSVGCYLGCHAIDYGTASGGAPIESLKTYTLKFKEFDAGTIARYRLDAAMSFQDIRNIYGDDCTGTDPPFDTVRRWIFVGTHFCTHAAESTSDCTYQIETDAYLAIELRYDACNSVCIADNTHTPDPDDVLPGAYLMFHGVYVASASNYVRLDGDPDNPCFSSYTVIYTANGICATSTCGDGTSFQYYEAIFGGESTWHCGGIDSYFSFGCMSYLSPACIGITSIVGSSTFIGGQIVPCGGADIIVGMGA